MSKFNCKICGKEKETYPSKIKEGRKYCSRKCYDISKIGIKLSEETKRKIGLKNKGRKHTKKSKRKMSISSMGKIGYWKGKKMSKESKRKMSRTWKGKKRPPFSKEWRENIGKARKGKYVGENHPNWKGGITDIRNRIRNSFKMQEWRQQVFIRDNFICQDCGDYTGGNLEAHHKKKSFQQLIEEVKRNLPLLDLYEATMLYAPFWNINNGQTLCEDCHRKIRKTIELE